MLKKRVGAISIEIIIIAAITLIVLVVLIPLLTGKLGLFSGGLDEIIASEAGRDGSESSGRVSTTTRTGEDGVTSEQTITIQLGLGYNLISLPVKPSDYSASFAIETIAPNIARITEVNYWRAWHVPAVDIELGESFLNGLTRKLSNDLNDDYSVEGLFYDARPSLVANKLVTLEPGKGYVFVMKVSSSIDVTGIPYTFQPTSLGANEWNMIGAPFTDIKLSDIDGTCENLEMKSIDEEGKFIEIEVNSDTMLESTKGYMIKSTVDCELERQEVDASAVPASASEVPADAIPVENCETPLDEEGETYVLKNDVSSEGTCFTIGADDIKFFGQGNTITYGTDTSYTYGIISLENNGIKIINVDIKQGGGGRFDYGIFLGTSEGSSVKDSTITTSGSSAVGIFFHKSDSNEISGNTITTSGRGGFGIHLLESDSSPVSGNTLTTSGMFGDGIRLSKSNSNPVSGNTITTSGDSGYGIRLVESDSNPVSGNTITTSGDNAGIRFHESDSNPVSGNTITTSGESGIGIIVGLSSNLNTINDNKIETIHGDGIWIKNSIDTESEKISENRIYNNLILVHDSESKFVKFTGDIYENYWNIEQLESKENKVGGPTIGGNYYARPDGTGFSEDPEQCKDEKDPKGICDEKYELDGPGGKNVDNYPLAKQKIVPPHTFVGAITQGGEPAPDGVDVTAWIDGVQVSSGIYVNSRYKLLVLQPSGESYSGKIITFKVDGVDANVEATWEAGSGQDLDLNIPSIPPAETPPDTSGAGTPGPGEPCGDYKILPLRCENEQTCPTGFTCQAENGCLCIADN